MMCDIPEKTIFLGLVGWDALVSQLHNKLEHERDFPEVGMGTPIDIAAKEILIHNSYDTIHAEELVRRYKESIQ